MACGAGHGPCSGAVERRAGSQLATSAAYRQRRYCIVLREGGGLAIVNSVPKYSRVAEAPDVACRCGIILHGLCAAGAGCRPAMRGATSWLERADA